MLVALLLGLAAAAPPKVDCDNPMTTADMLHCGDEDLKIAESALSKAYQAANAVMVAMDIDRDISHDKRMGYRDALVASQSAWLKYRDAQCVAEAYSGRGGSIEPVLKSACVADLTRARTKQLQDLVKMYND